MNNDDTRAGVPGPNLGAPMRTTMLCQGCLEQMRMPIAIRGPFSPLYRAFGIRRSRMHPNLCTRCESQFTQVKKQKQIEMPATIMFARRAGDETAPDETCHDL